MGLMDKLKAAKNFVTGGGADVLVEVENARIGEPFTVRVGVRVDDSPLEVRRVYVKVRSFETVELPETQNDRAYDVSEADNDDTPSASRREREETYETEVNLTGAVDLAAGAKETWEGEVTLPASCMPTYRGRNARHDWQIFAGLDVTGNDPDSGWVDIEVR